jgi:hypothetical protein
MLRFAFLLMVTVLMETGVASAQWVNLRTPDIPRTADGKPNLNAPAPRLDGDPDLSGVWRLIPTQDFGLLGLPSGAEFGNIGASLQDGLPYQPWAAARVMATKTNLRKYDPLMHCLAVGPVRFQTVTFYRQIIQLPQKLVLLNEYNTSYRQIFTDGRALAVDPVPTVNGYSIGAWEGDTLVVRTTGFRDGTWLDANGSPLTASGRITERYRRVSMGKLDIELTVDDPKAYTKPWTITLHQELMPDTDLFDAVCAEADLDRLRQEEAQP